jgi:hypothetical protein
MLFIIVFNYSAVVGINGGNISLQNSVISQSALRQVHSLFQSQFYAESDLGLPLSISNNFSFP